MKEGIDIIICGGGTAGHIYPAVSIIEHLKDEKGLKDVLTLHYIGTEKGPESEIIKPLGVDFYDIRASGIKKSANMFSKLKVYVLFFFALIAGLLRSIVLIKKIDPSVVLGMGGYVCAPVLLAAIILRKKIALHEQNYIPGRLNLFFSRSAEKVFLSFEDTVKYFRKNKKTKYIYSGNPVRKAISAPTLSGDGYHGFDLERDRFTIVAFGGSLGAKNINLKVLGCYDDMRKRKDIQFLLIPGKRFYGDCLAILQSGKKDTDNLVFSIRPYIDQMEKAYAVADLVISRAGANTIAELLNTNTPSILIPYPDAIADHQSLNAGYLAEKGKAIMIDDNKLESILLIEIIDSLLKDDKKRYLSMKSKKFDRDVSKSPKIIVDNLLEGVQ